MTYADVVNQMQTIQAQLVQLGLLRPTTGSGSAASAASFATALDGASAPAAAGTATASPDGITTGSGVTGDDVVQAALEYKGVPYVLGGESRSGIDCSGLVQAAFSKLGVDVPRTVHEQQVVGEQVGSLKDAKPGDLIVLNGGDHIAIYMGNDTVIHAPYPGRTVSVQKAWFDDGDITSIRRIVPATDDATAAPTGAPATSASGLSASTVARATAMLATSGADAGLPGTSLGALLGAPGLGGTSSSSTQQLLAGRAALLGTGV